MKMSEVREVLLTDGTWHLIEIGSFARKSWLTPGTAGFTATEIMMPGRRQIHGPMSSVQAVRMADQVPR
jgi:hypothetical protein